MKLHARLQLASWFFDSGSLVVLLSVFECDQIASLCEIYLLLSLSPQRIATKGFCGYNPHIKNLAFVIS